MSSSYFDRIKDDVIRIKQETGSKLKVSVAMAQMALESAYGRSELARNANNHGGHKYDKLLHGDKWYIKDAYEYDEDNDKEVVDKDAMWGKYDTIQDFIRQHFLWLTSTPAREKIYANVLDATTADRQAFYLMGTYATDLPRTGSIGYYKKIMNIINQYNLTQYDKEETTMTKLRVPIKKHTLVNKGGYISGVKYIVIHFVGASGQALANANYFYNVMRSASAHIFIDKNVTYEVVPENRVGWHVGDGLGRYGITNNNAIGIEGCQDTSTGRNVWEWQFHPNTYEQMLLQTSAWMDKYNVPINRVVRHYDASRKSCPGNWMANDWAKWHQFKKDLAELRKSGTVEVGGSTEANSYNPKGYQETEIPTYRQPTQAFKEMQVGDKVTYRQVFNWYNPETEKFIVSPYVSTYYGKEDEITAVKEADGSYSKRAYQLKNSMSWVLEQDLEEPREDWGKNTGAGSYTVQSGDYLYKIAEQFGITVDQLKEWNNLESNVIFTGMELFVVEPVDKVEKGDEPDGTDDRSDVTPAPEQPEDKGEETPAIELQEGEYIDKDGIVWVWSKKE